jgi:hypothetical protein
MASYTDDFFTQAELDLLISFAGEPVVSGKREFFANVPETISAKLGVSSNNLPMTWIIGDSAPHIDGGEGDFEETIVVYLRASSGSLILSGIPYEIKENRVFRFPKGTEHSTIDAGLRLVLGPMSNTGFRVGGVYINYFASAADVYPEPNLSNVVYTDSYVSPNDGVIAASTTFPNSSSIPPPYAGAVLSYWTGQEGYSGNYVDVSYNPGVVWENNGYDTYLYPIWRFQERIMCFKEDTKILCLEDGIEQYFPIQNLRKGVLVKTLTSGYKPISYIGHSKIYNQGDSLRSKNRLYICHKEQYPELNEPLVLTGCHSLLVRTITDKEHVDTLELMGKIYITENMYRLMACIDERAKPYEEEGVFSIWHLALENEHDRANYGIYANGLLVESSSNRMMREYSGMTLL